MGNSPSKDGRDLTEADADYNPLARSDHVVSIQSADPMAPPMPEIPPLHRAPLMFAPQMGPSFVGPQPIVYNAQAAQMQSPQPYIHPNAGMGSRWFSGNLGLLCTCQHIHQLIT